MKIQGRKNPMVTSLGPLSLPAAAEAAPSVEQTTPAVGDSVDLSATQQLRSLNQALQSIPEVRIEKVEGLRGAIEEGNYYVESDKLARKVVDEVLTEALIEESQSRQAH